MYKLHRAIPASTRAPSTAALHRRGVALSDRLTLSDRLISRCSSSCCCCCCPHRLLLRLLGPARARGRAAEEVGALPLVLVGGRPKK